MSSLQRQMSARVRNGHGPLPGAEPPTEEQLGRYFDHFYQALLTEGAGTTAAMGRGEAAEPALRGYFDCYLLEEGDVAVRGAAAPEGEAGGEDVAP